LSFYTHYTKVNFKLRYDRRTRLGVIHLDCRSTEALRCPTRSWKGPGSRWFRNLRPQFPSHGKRIQSLGFRGQL